MAEERQRHEVIHDKGVQEKTAVEILPDETPVKTPPEKTEQEKREMEVVEAINRLPKEPFSIETREYRSGDTTSDFNELVSAFPTKFTALVEVRGIKQKIVCNRISPMDLFDDDEDPTAIPTTKEMYEDSITVISKVVESGDTPQVLAEKLHQLPVTLVTGISARDYGRDFATLGR